MRKFDVSNLNNKQRKILKNNLKIVRAGLTGQPSKGKQLSKNY